MAERQLDGNGKLPGVLVVVGMGWDGMDGGWVVSVDGWKKSQGQPHVLDVWMKPCKSWDKRPYQLV